MKFRAVIFILFCFFIHSSRAALNCDLRQAQRLNKQSFDACSQEALDAFYLKLNWGSKIPQGFFEGRVQLARSELPGKTLIARLRQFVPGFIREQEELLMERFWKGKVFYSSKKSAPVLWNRILGRSEAFPAHVYVGKSLFDEHRKSLVIDYLSNQDIDGYRASRDGLVNSKALAIRDEIREVRPGLYLGRAYVRGKFFLNFILEEASQ
jgi:hypothetical protein